jgi:hypothetical protein
MDEEKKGTICPGESDLLRMFNEAAAELTEVDRVERERLVDAFAHSA